MSDRTARIVTVVLVVVFVLVVVLWMVFGPIPANG